MSYLKILMLEDNACDADLIQTTLKKTGLHLIMKLVSSRKDFIDALDYFVPELILSDHHLPQFSSNEALKICREKIPYIPFILITGAVSDEFAASIIKQGADDYVLKDNLKRLPGAIVQAIEKEQTEKAQALLVSIINSSEDGIISKNLDGTLTSWNAGAEKLFGYSATEALGKNITLIIPADRLQEEPAIIAKIQQGEFINHYETQRLKRNGALIHISLTVSPIKDLRGNITGASKIARDINERIETDRQKEFDRNNLSALINNTNDLMWSVDKDLRIITFNDSFSKTIESRSGYPLKKGGDILSTQFTGDQLMRYKAYYERALAGETFSIIDHFESPAEIWSEISFYPIRHGDAVIGTACFSRNITERKRAEEKLRNSVERFKYATIATSDIIWEQDFSNMQYQVHEGRGKLTGFDNIVNWKLGLEGKFIVAGDRTRVKRKFLEARLNPVCELWQDEYSVCTEDNTVLHIINHAIFIRDEKGMAIKAIGAITDITEKKRMEVKLLEQQKKEQLTIIATALDAQEKERQAIGMELHDNVNQILVAASLMLSTGKKNPEKTLEMITISMQYLRDAIQENRKIAHVFVAPDLETETLVDQLEKLVTNMLNASGQTTHITITDFNECLLNKDRKINIYRIAQEQCTNIVKYANASSIQIILTTSGGLFKMTISDNGTGMEAGKKTAGIGLKNINGRLSIFAGTSNITTGPGKGFTLEITMPLETLD